VQEFSDKQPSKRLRDSTTESRLHSCNSDNTLNAEGACAAVNGFKYAQQPISYMMQIIYDIIYHA
jgi:hypothetical protein